MHVISVAPTNIEYRIFIFLTFTFNLTIILEGQWDGSQTQENSLQYVIVAFLHGPLTAEIKSWLPEASHFYSFLGISWHRPHYDI